MYLTCRTGLHQGGIFGVGIDPAHICPQPLQHTDDGHGGAAGGSGYGCVGGGILAVGVVFGGTIFCVVFIVICDIVTISVVTITADIIIFKAFE